MELGISLLLNQLLLFKRQTNYIAKNRCDTDGEHTQY